MKDVSIVVPVYNEAERLRKNIPKIIKEIEKITKNYELIIAEDGSTDGTDKVAEKLSTEFKNIVHQHYEEKLGKGKTLKKALEKSKGEIFIFIDVDLATDLKHLKELIEQINNGYDIVIGSRRIKGAKVERELKRKITSFCYNSLIRCLFRDGIKDHQCGFKAFKREALKKIIDEVEDNKWFWDTEVLVRAKKKGLKIKEIPVGWKEPKKSAESRVNILADSKEMFFSALKLKIKLFKENRLKRIKKEDTGLRKAEFSKQITKPQKFTPKKQTKKLLEKPRHKFNQICEKLSKNEMKAVFIFTLLWGSVFAYWFWSQNLTLVYVDAISRYGISRSVVDSLTPGFVNFGGVWLPLPQFAMLLFVWNDFLFYSGWAGIIPSLIAFSLSCVFLYKLSSEFFKSKKLGLFALLIYITNINLLYFASIPMSEIYCLLFLISSTYFFYKWVETDNIYFLCFAGFSTLLGTLVRYDLWFMPFYFAFLIVLKYTIFSENKIKILNIISIFEKKLKTNYHKIEGLGLIYLVPAVAGIFGWIIYNWIILGNPLYFAFSEYSARAMQLALDFLPTEHNILKSILYYTSAVIYICGPGFLLSVILGGVYLIKKPNMKTLSVFAFFVPFVFYLASLYEGHGVIYTPNLPPYNSFNIRYGLMMLPFVIIFVTSISKFIKFNVKNIFIIICFLLMNYLFIFNQGLTAVTSTELNIDHNVKEKMSCASIIDKFYMGGKILVTSKNVPWRKMYYSKIPYAEYIIVNNHPIWDNALKKPWNYSKWIIASKSASYIKEDPGAIIFDSLTIAWMYTLEYQDPSVKLLKLNESRIPPNITGYFSVENATVEENKLRFLLLNYDTPQEDIYINTKCIEPDNIDIEFPLHIENMTILEGMYLTLPWIPSCQKELLTVEGFNHSIEKEIIYNFNTSTEKETAYNLNTTHPG